MEEQTIYLEKTTAEQAVCLEETAVSPCRQALKSYFQALRPKKRCGQSRKFQSFVLIEP